MTKLSLSSFRIAAFMFGAVALLSAVALLQVSAYAQDDQANAVDPPSRVARLSYVSGNASFQPNGVDDWVTATLNRPLTTSDRLWTERDARAELQIGNATMRLSGETSFTLANLEDRTVQIQIAQGVMNVRLRQLETDETFEIDTPNFTLNLLRAGEYRIQVDNEKDVSWVTVRSGSAEATGGAQAVTVQPGQQARFSGNNAGTYEVNGALGPDGFDQWCSARDRRVQGAHSAQYVSRNVIGYEDLDDYGTWRTYEDYGQVWVPTVVSTGWAPYRNGHWAWIYPWGWTWVDDAPWGFAPFHYGRWVHAGFGWAWVPGPIYVRPVYAPALVAWFGGSGGGVGWFALGPREPFIPWYWGSQRYFSRVNYTNTRITNININNYYNNYYHPRWGDHDGRHDRDDVRTIAHIDYANRHAPNGMTFVDHDSFVNGRPVSKFAMRVPPANLRNAPVLTDIDAKPDRKSVLGGHDDNARFRPPEKAFDRPVVSRDVAPKRVPFETQAKTFGAPRAVTPDVRTRTSGDGAAKTQTHVTVTAPREGATMPSERGQEDRTVRTNSDARRAVPRPPERTMGNQSNAPAVSGPGTGRMNPEHQTDVHVDFGPRYQNPTQADAPVNRQRWEVPKPPEDRQTTVGTTGREMQNQPPASNPVRDGQRSGQPETHVSTGVEIRQNVNVNNGRSTTTREVYRPPQQERVQRNVNPPQSTTVREVPRPAERVQQRPASPVQQRPAERAPEARQNNSNTNHSNQGAARAESHTQQGNSSKQGRRSE
jgi:hypothetical protein